MIVLEIVLVIVAAFVAGVFALRLIGGREPVYAVSDTEPAFFIALKCHGPCARTVYASGVIEKWAVDADFTFIGEGERYWDRFIVAAGGDATTLPVKLGGDVEDAYIVRLKLGQPPRLVLGVIRLLVAARIWRMPGGELMTDPSALGLRTDVMPGPRAIDTLLSRPAGYRPAMVNFLKYHGTARYAEKRPGAEDVSGATAYNRYGIVAMQTVCMTGGHLVFYGRVLAVLRDAKSAPTLGDWDDIAVMQYSEPKAILTMEQRPRYRAALAHRDAGLEKSIVIASTK